jgi:hypothetical protein
LVILKVWEEVNGGEVEGKWRGNGEEAEGKWRS